MEIKIIRGGKPVKVYRSDIIPRVGENVKEPLGLCYPIENIVYVYGSQTNQLLHVELWLGIGI